MSADDNGSSEANKGVTLPANNDAIHNIGLSPLFLSRNGHTPDWDSIEWLKIVIGVRAGDGWLWSANSYNDATAYWLHINAGNIFPSDRNARHYANSLRCLVSTANKLMDKAKVRQLGER